MQPENDQLHARTLRILGAAFLVVIFTSGLAGALHTAVIGSEDIADVLRDIDADPTLYRISILAELFNSAAIIVLAALLYTVLSRQNRIVALAALGWWLAEAITLAASKLGGYALLGLSEDFVAAGAPTDSHYLSVGKALYEGIDRPGYTLHMLFYCLGGVLWYFLFYRAAIIPRPLALFGVAAAALGLGGITLEFLGSEMPIFVYLPIGVFELSIGFWLLIRGPRTHPEATPQPVPAR